MNEQPKPTTDDLLKHATSLRWEVAIGWQAAF